MIELKAQTKLLLVLPFKVIVVLMDSHQTQQNPQSQHLLVAKTHLQRDHPNLTELNASSLHITFFVCLFICLFGFYFCLFVFVTDSILST